MIDLASRLTPLQPPDHELVASSPRPFCLVIEPRTSTQFDFLHQHLLAPEKPDRG